MTSHEHVPQGDVARLSGRLWVAVRRFDDELARSVINRAMAVLTPGDVADLVVVPVLRRLGETWHVSDRTIAVEHFTSSMVRSLFQAHSAGASQAGRLAVCFAPSGDQHELGVHIAAAVLVDAGWRTRILGADTPCTSAAAAVEALDPGLVVVGACMREAAEVFLASDVSRRRPVLAGGAGFVAGDAAAWTDMVVHHGPFAAVPEIAARLVGRVRAGG